jgi:hypothetical protein
MEEEYKKLEKLSGRYNDLTGMKINMFEILYPVERPSWAWDMSIYWMCRCECGNERVYPASRLKGAKAPKSCGCALYERLDGKKFNKLTVIKESGRDNNGKRMWLCICDCGTETCVEASSLIKGYTKSCGCLKHEKLDLVGQKFEMWTVISRAENNSYGKVFWNCKCECGTERILSSGSLRKGKPKSCGCLNKIVSMNKVEDLTGQKFGRWTVISIQRIVKNNHSRVFWLCRCDCGNEKVVAARTLKSNQSLSCGCLKKEKLFISNSLEDGESAFNKLLYSYKRGAKDRGLCFELSVEDFKKLTKGDCFYCGSYPNTEKESFSIKKNYLYNGIDRLNNNLGYTKENSVSCCGRCNIMKMEMSIEDFKNQVSRIYNYFIMKEN